IEIDKRLRTPDLLLDLLAGDQLPGIFGEQSQNPHRLRRELDQHAPFSQLAVLQIQLEIAEPQQHVYSIRLCGRNGPFYTLRYVTDSGKVIRKWEFSMAEPCRLHGPARRVIP